MRALTTSYKLRVLFDEDINEDDVRKIISIEKDFIRFSDYNFKQFEFPKEFLGPYQGLTKAIHPGNEKYYLTEYFEKIRNEKEIISILTGKPLLHETIDLEGYIFPQLCWGYAGPHRMGNKKIEAGGVAIVSTAGLGNEYIGRSAGILLHELGELFILIDSHCNDESCFMYAPSASYLFTLQNFEKFYPVLDKSKYYCERCRERIRFMIKEREKSEILNKKEIEDAFEEIEQSIYLMSDKIITG